VTIPQVVAAGVVTAATLAASPLASTSPRAVVAFGDSLTWGAGSGSSNGPGVSGPDGSGYQGDSYPSQLAALSGWQVTNQGINGDMVTSGSVNDPLNATVRFEQLAPTEPAGTVFVVWIGVNDVEHAVGGSQIVTGYARMITAAHDAGDLIFLATLPPVAGLAAIRETQRRNVNNWIRQGHGQDGTIDLEAALGTPVKLSPQLVANGQTVNPVTSVPHLNPAGYAVVANFTYAKVTHPVAVVPPVSYP
jgi:lysophospholipase L1-like esterase